MSQAQLPQRNRHQRRHPDQSPQGPVPSQPDPQDVKKLEDKLKALEVLINSYPFLRSNAEFDDFYAVTDHGEFDFEWTLKDYKNNDVERGEIKLIALPPTFHKLPDGSLIQRVSGFYDVNDGVLFAQCTKEQREFIERGREGVIQTPEEIGV